MSNLIEERRGFERFSARFPAKYQHARDQYGADVFLSNASASGFRITTCNRLYLHDSVSLEVELPDGEGPMVLNGRVMWVKEQAPHLWDAGLVLHQPDLIGMRRIFRQVSPE